MIKFASPDDRPVRARLYARFSPRPNGDECDSIDVQLDDIRRYCDANGIMVADEYHDSEVSGATAPSERDRPGMWTLLNELEQGELVIVRNIDRVARDMTVFCVIENEIETRRAKLISVNGEGTFGNTAQDKFLRTIFQAFAVMQRDVIRDITAAKMQAHQKAGRRMTAKHNVPWGKLAIDVGEQKRLVDNPYEIEAICLARALWRRWKHSPKRSLRHVTRHLYARGFTNRDGGQISHQMVRRFVEDIIEEEARVVQVEEGGYRR